MIINRDRINRLKYINDRYDKETSYRSITLSTEKFDQILDSILILMDKTDRLKEILRILKERLDEDGLKILEDAIKDSNLKS